MLQAHGEDHGKEGCPPLQPMKDQGVIHSHCSPGGAMPEQAGRA